MGRHNNKNRQFGPAGPDAKTAARFRRRCGWRYVGGTSEVIS